MHAPTRFSLAAATARPADGAGSPRQPNGKGPSHLLCNLTFIAHLGLAHPHTRIHVRHLLPSLDVVAVSQAPSPESNPNSPLPVKTMVGLYPTIES